MSKILLEFQMPEDRDDYEIYSQALRAHSLLHDLAQELRSCCKHGKPTKRDEFWRDRFYELLTENEVKIF